MKIGILQIIISLSFGEGHKLAKAVLTLEPCTRNHSVRKQRLPKLPKDQLERGKAIRKERVARGIIQMEFAHRVDVRFSRYTQIEGGAIEPKLPELKRIAHELGFRV